MLADVTVEIEMQPGILFPFAKNVTRPGALTVATRFEELR
jgi:hypothetical protein